MPSIIYLANARMPTEKAHGIQIAKMCEAFVASGAQVELMLPRRFNRLKASIFSYYGIDKNFTVKKVWCLDLLPFPFAKRFSYLVEIHSFAKFVWWHMVLRYWSAKPIIYSRDLWPVVWLPRRFRIVYEVHSLPKKISFIFRRELARVNQFVAISQGLKNDLVALGIAPERILVAADAVDIKQFSLKETQKECRKRLNLPLDAEIVLYSGHLYAWKGAQTLLAAAGYLRGLHFVFVGGTKRDVKRFRAKVEEKQLSHVSVLGHRSWQQIPDFLHAANILILPNSSQEQISSRYTSPLKLFEYMAARRPIVASDLPSIREVLDESLATFFTPNNPKSLAEAIKLVLAHPEESAQKADRAYEKVKGFTWEKRAENILQFLCAE